MNLSDEAQVLYNKVRLKVIAYRNSNQFHPQQFDGKIGLEGVIDYESVKFLVSYCPCFLLDQGMNAHEIRLLRQELGAEEPEV